MWPACHGPRFPRRGHTPIQIVTETERLHVLDSGPLLSELEPGETIEWAGRPNPRHVFTLVDLLLVPFSLLWAGFAFFWEGTVIIWGAPLFFAIWGVPFVLIGTYLVFGRFLFAAWDKRHTWYGVTNRRAIILSTTFGRRVQSLFLNKLPLVELRALPRGRGTLLLGQPPTFQNFGAFGAFPTSSRRLAPGFYDIPDARAVFELINRLRSASA
jgi:hypothetical protein